MIEPCGFVFDIDMTAVPNGAQSVESQTLRDAFEKLPNEVIAIAATGRSPEVALPITQALNLRHESVVANGALIIDSITGEVKWHRMLSEKQVSGLIRACSPYNHQMYLAGDPYPSYRLARDQAARQTPAIYLKDVPPEDAHDIRELLLSEVPGTHIYLSPAWSGEEGFLDLNIGHIEAKKHNALIELFGRYAIDGTEMIGVGDGINDIELFEVVGHKVAVANAHPQLIELADEVVASQAEDGLAEVVRRFHPQKVDPVVTATDRRIHERGLAEFKRTIDHMAEDPNWHPPKMPDIIPGSE